MSDIAIEISHLWKKFQRGEVHDSLRDLVPALVRRVVRRGPKRYNLGEGEFWALKDVNFQLSRGEIVGIIGPNGSGKSTLLKILSRILRPNSGFVRVNGRLSALIEVAAGFHPDLTGRENVYLNGSILGMKNSEVKRKFDEIVSFSEIEKFIDTPVKRYSSGMYVRLAFAVAAHLEPEILLVDEVLAVGDAGFQKKCLGKMEDVAKEGRTVLFVSHNMGAVNTLCQKAVLLENGSIAQAGERSRVTEAYLAQQINGGQTERGYRVNLNALNGQQIDSLRIANIELFNPKIPDVAPRTGDPLLIRITYGTNRRFLSPAFVVMLKELYGQEVIRLSTMPISGYEISPLYSKGTVDLRSEE